MRRERQQGARFPAPEDVYKRQVEQRLEQVARQANVTISHETKPVVIEGMSRLIDELIYNCLLYTSPAGGCCRAVGR